ncbi:LysE family translocator [Orrella sp. NBD-18]|uniref:LysE family translocator n=1 Tax=Sheuella amnicola TaxID=2707330 RepID=A0A6B2QV15_9BURK|nr:LysE family translocator [Sheuella amnicola]NDY82210.1 LysE family translocator [Sheuella amnicola]HBI83293.1 lysine transporter LysE [Alcaligenaceae bacterium]
MIPGNEWLLFAGAALVLVLSPGPNMIYLISRSICQGRKAGVISLFGVTTALFLHVTAASLGLSAIFITVPLAYEALKWAGAIYLFYLAWQAVKPGARSPFEARDLPEDSPSRLFVMGFFTSALNPKIAIFYLSIFPQFILPERGSVVLQGLMLGATQICMAFTINLLITLSAATIANWFAGNQKWLAVQRYVMGFVLAALAIRIALEQRKVA